jgi:hypothetical protein
MTAAAPAPSATPTAGAPPTGVPPAAPAVTIVPPKTDAAVPAANVAAPVADPAKPSAPEAYQPFKLPEGFSIAEEDATTIASLGREFKLDQGGAQKMVDAAAAFGQRLVAQAEQAREAASAKENETWEAEIEADPTLGGAARPKTLELIQRVGAAFDPQGEVLGPKGILGARGLGNQPALARFLTRIGQAIREDAPPPGGAGGGGAVKDSAEILYPNDRPRS